MGGMGGALQEVQKLTMVCILAMDASNSLSYLRQLAPPRKLLDVVWLLLDKGCLNKASCALS